MNQAGNGREPMLAIAFARVRKTAFGRLLLCGLLGIGLGLTAPASAQERPPQDIDVKARKSGSTVIIDVSLLVAATSREAWDVLTDYDHMPQFLSNLQVSKIVSRSPTRLQVAQKGGVSRGPIAITFDVLRDVQLKPFQQIDSRVVSGDLKQVDSTTRLAPEGDGTRITFHSESIPNVWVPPGIGPALIEKETRGQFADMRTEILRRKSAKP